MDNNDLTKQFGKYVIPSMLTMILTGFYGIVDGFFIGQVMGDDGLAAINIAWPLLSLLSSIGVGIGTGGAIIMSIRKGQGKELDAKKAEGTALVLLAAASLVFMVIYLFFSGDLLKLLGAEGILYTYGTKYMKVVTWGAFFQIMGAGLNPILKNLGKPFFSMAIMVLGMCINILLDWMTLYVFHMGLEGVALATCAGQAAVFLCGGVTIFKMKICPRWYIPSKKLAAEILKIGVSPFGLTMAPGIVIIFTNLQCLNYGGTAGVAVYTVVSYAAYVIYSLMQGLADGIQPLISFCKGLGDEKGVADLLKKAFAAAGIFCIAFMIITALVRYQFPIIYGVSHEVATASIPAMMALVAAIPFIAVARIMSAYFYAIDDSRNSSILVYADPFIFTPLFLLALPKVFGIMGIWMTYPATQASIAATAFAMKKFQIKEKNQLEFGEE